MRGAIRSCADLMVAFANGSRPKASHPLIRRILPHPLASPRISSHLSALGSGRDLELKVFEKQRHPRSISGIGPGESAIMVQSGNDNGPYHLPLDGLC